MIYLKKTEIVAFDEATERERINECFKGRQKKILLRILETFCRGEFAETIKALRGLKRDEKLGCHEVEYVHEMIHDTMQELIHAGKPGKQTLKYEIGDSPYVQ